MIGLMILWFGPSPGLAEDTLEHSLALKDSDIPISEDHFTVVRFRALLATLSQAYGEDKIDISNMSKSARDQLIENGINEKILTIMEGMDRIVADQTAKHTYAVTLSAYIALRIQGQPHSGAIGGILSLLKDMK